MGILLAFAPFLAFALVERLVGPVAGLVTGALVSLALLLRDLAHGRPAKLLEIGTVILFGGLSLYAQAAAPGWSTIMVKLLVDAGLLLIVLASLAIGRPFTLQYAREQVPAAYWQTPQFLHVNRVITAAWALAFAVMVGAELMMLHAPGIPLRFGVIATILALAGAIWFTGWYPRRQRRAAGGDQAPG